MALLLETTLGDLVVDLDVEGSPALCRNIIKLAKARYYTATLIYNVQPNRFCQLGCPRGDGTGGGCLEGLLDHGDDITASRVRFLKSKGRVLTDSECRQRGRVVATEMNGIADTIGSQFLITLEQGEGRALDGYIPSHAKEKPQYLSLGVVTEDDDNVLDKIHNAYCDANGRPYADIRIERALVLHDPFDDPPEFDNLLQKRGVVVENGQVTASPSYERPPEERVEMRIPANQVEEEEDELDVERARQREEEIRKKEDSSRAVVLEMLGDLPSADIKAPEEVLFVCKLNPITEDEDLELIFSRFDPNVKVEIIRDAETGASLQYAFVEFSNKKQCAEAYFKMDGALIDDRRIKVDFSQSVSKVWDKYNQKMRGGGHPVAPNRKMEAPRNFSGPRPGGLQPRGNHGGPPREDRDRDNHRSGPPPNDRGRFGPPSNGHDRGHYEGSRNDGHRQGERHHHNNDGHGDERDRRRDYSPRRESERDDHGRRRRSPSASPRDRSHERKRRKKHHRHERSHRDDDGERERHAHDKERRHSSGHRDYEDDRRSSHKGEDDHSRHRESGDDNHRRRHDDDEDRRKHRHRKHHSHHRDDGRREKEKHRDEHRHRKRKEEHRRSRSRS